MLTPEIYQVLKELHRGCAVLSIAGFTLRWLAALAGQGWVRGRAARTLPHAVDTVLLASALAMAFAAGIAPWRAPWLAGKIVGLLLYIALGMLALSPRRSRRLRLAAGAGALLVFAHIVAMAWFKHPAGVFRAWW